jgi:Rieske Fe-S protein
MSSVIQVSVTSESAGSTRRSFYVTAIHAIWAMMAAILGVPAVMYLFGSPKSLSGDEWADVGDISALPIEQPVELVCRRNRSDGWKIVSDRVTAWVVKTRDKGVVAFGPQCTHLGCAHHWDHEQNRFVCPCHNSLFSIDGKNLSGPAPRPLDRYDVKVERNRLLLGRLRRQDEGPSV